MRNYIMSFCREFGYPEEANKTILDSFERIYSNTNAKQIFENQVDLYNNDKLKDHQTALACMDKAANLAGTHKYTVHLLLYICLSKHTKELYKKRNIPYSIFFDSMSDLKWKLFECYNIYGIWGSFVAWWFPRFFNLTRFALGRLQYETVKFDRIYTKNGNTLNLGDIVLNIHIPSNGPLKHEDCLESYRLAAKFYKDYFPNKPVAFRCESWLLYPKQKEFLPQTSNILKFMDDFDIIDSYVDENASFLWRIYGTMETNCLDNLPKNSSLQRAYADWLGKGNKVGSGLGVFFYNK